MTPRLVGQAPIRFERHDTGGPNRVFTLVKFEHAAMRIVHAKRARKLRRRGEFVLRLNVLTRTGRSVFAWFVARPGAGGFVVSVPA